MSTAPDRWKTRDDLLMWLNDRTDRMAQLAVMIGPESAFPARSATTVLTVTGRLIHWRGAIPVEAWPDVERHGDHSGAYAVGSGVLYVPENARGCASASDDGRVEVLYLPFDEATGAYIAVADDDHPMFGRDG